MSRAPRDRRGAGGAPRRRRDHAPAPRPAAEQPPPQPPGPLTARWAAAVVLALAFLWLVTFLPQVMGQVFVQGDAPLYRDYGDFSQAEWSGFHRRTLWNPFVFFGLPSAASLADPRPQWLPDALLSAWDAITRPPHGWMLGPPLLAHLAGMIAIAALARRLWRAGPAGMVVAGLVWGLAPNLVVPFALGHDAQAIAAGLIPVVLWTADVALTAPGRTAAVSALGLALALACQVLGGHPQFVMFGLVPLALLAGLRRREARGPRRLALVGGALGLGLVMSAVLWWPAWLYLGDTLRGEARFATRNAREFSLAARDLLALAWPRAVGWAEAGYWGGQRATDYANTLGAIGFALAAWGALGGPRASRGMARGLLGLAAAAALLSMGQNLPLVGSWVLGLPLLSWFRTPSTWMVLAQLAGALLAARGWEAVAQAAARRRIAFRIAAAGLLLAAGLALLARSRVEQAWRGAALTGFELREAAGVLHTDENRRTFPRVLPEASRRAADDLVLRLAVLGLIAAAAASRPSPGTSRFVFGSAALLLAVDLGSLVVPVTRRYSGPPSGLLPEPGPPYATEAAADPRHRAYPLDTGLYFSNDWITWRARTVAGLHGAVPQRWSDLRRGRLLLWQGFVRAVAVRYMGGNQFSVQDSSDYDVSPAGVLIRRDALPRAYAVPLVAAVADDSLALQAMATAVFEPDRVAYTTDREVAGDYPGSETATITWVRDLPDSLEIRVRAVAPAFVVVADSWFRGWNATLDGAPVSIARVNHVLRGIAVPPGEHRVAMAYVPAGWRLGRAATFAGWLAWLAAAAMVAFAGRAARPVRSGAPVPAAAEP